MKRHSTPVKFIFFGSAKVSAVLLMLFVAAGCGGSDSAASKSASEFDRAQAEGSTQAATIGGAHGGHGGKQDSRPRSADEDDSGAMAGMDHSKMPGMEPPSGARAQGGAMAGMDHSNMPGMKPTGRAATPAGSMGGMDHASMPGMKPAPGARPQSGAMAGMDHSNMPGMTPAVGAKPQAGAMAGMDHTNMPGMKPAAGATPAPGGAMGGMNHSNMPGMSMAPPVPEPAAAIAQPGQPAATLRPGDLDGPAPTSVREAARSAEMAQSMASGGHGMAHGTYSQTDAGRDDVAPSGGSMSPAHGGHAPGTPPAADPHQMHAVPVPRPTPSPAATPTTTRFTRPRPTADPHAGHGQPASPRPQPSPGTRENER